VAGRQVRGRTPLYRLLAEQPQVHPHPLAAFRVAQSPSAARNPLECLDLDLDLAEPGTSRAVLARRVDGTKHLLAETTWSITVLS
jgi:hypothetical protein